MESKKQGFAMYMRVGNESQLTHKKKAALYCRAAQGETREQREALLEYAKAHDLIVAGCYEDVGSGLTIDRPGMSRMLSDYKAGEFDVVIVTDRARLARSLPLYTQLPFEVLSLI